MDFYNNFFNKKGDNMEFDKMFANEGLNKWVVPVLGFKKLCLPVVISIIWLIGLVCLSLLALFSLVTGEMAGFFGSLGGILGLRLYCELMYVLFGVYNRLGRLVELKETSIKEEK